MNTSQSELNFLACLARHSLDHPIPNCLPFQSVNFILALLIFVACSRGKLFAYRAIVPLGFACRGVVHGLSEFCSIAVKLFLVVPF